MHCTRLSTTSRTIVERVFTDRRGISVRVTLAISCINGIRNISVLSIVPVISLHGETKQKNVPLLLSKTSSFTYTDKELVYRLIPSPYLFSLDIFLTSQMTRAPSL